MSAWVRVAFAVYVAALCVGAIWAGETGRLTGGAATVAATSTLWLLLLCVPWPQVAERLSRKTRA